MTGWTRREMLRAGAGAAMVAVPMAALSVSQAGAATGDTGAALAQDELDAVGGGSVMFSILDAATGEVAIYHGRNEVIVQDRALVARIVRAARLAGAR